MMTPVVAAALGMAALQLAICVLVVWSFWLLGDD